MGVSRFLDWVKERSHLFRGATFGTLQRNDAFHFARLGTFFERADLPRSLLACVNEINQTLAAIPGRTGLEAKRLAAELHARLHYARIDEALNEGLQQYLEKFLADIYELGTHIHRAYLEAA